MGRNVQIGDLADAIMETLEDYADLAAEDVKRAVREAGIQYGMRFAPTLPRIPGITQKAGR